ncbi:TetR/AcrR family transcriptional regulator C-terminal domain-containing protein, partial [Frankia sp. CcWB2]
MEGRKDDVRHPGAVSLLLGGPMDGPNALALNERLLAALADGGVPAANAARSVYLLIVYVLGAIALEAAEPHEPGTSEAERIAARRDAFAAVPAEHYPRTASQIDVLAAYVTTEQFSWGLDRVLDGIERLIEPDA